MLTLRVDDATGEEHRDENERSHVAHTTSM